MIICKKKIHKLNNPKKRISPIVVPTIEEETSKKASPKKVQNKQSKEVEISDKKATSKTKTSPTKKTVENEKKKIHKLNNPKKE